VPHVRWQDASELTRSAANVEKLRYLGTQLHRHPAIRSPRANGGAANDTLDRRQRHDTLIGGAGKTCTRGRAADAPMVTEKRQRSHRRGAYGATPTARRKPRKAHLTGTRRSPAQANTLDNVSRAWRAPTRLTAGRQRTPQRRGGNDRMIGGKANRHLRGRRGRRRRAQRTRERAPTRCRPRWPLHARRQNRDLVGTGSGQTRTERARKYDERRRERDPGRCRRY